MTKLDKKLKTKWLAALRSGKYKKGEGYLKEGDRYCCLGVLCEISNLKSEQSLEYDSGSVLYSYKNEDLADSETLPSDFREELGITILQQEKLVTINDESKTFDKVIKYISRSL